jgi:hypothetical protein
MEQVPAAAAVTPTRTSSRPPLTVQCQPFFPDEVERLIQRRPLRDELDYLDESIDRVNIQHLTLAENDFLASMLAWEQAPVLPIYRWFEPELGHPPRPADRRQPAQDPLGRDQQAPSEADRAGLHRPS